MKPLVDYVLKTLNVGPEALFSTLGRTAARGVETLAIAQQIEHWLDEYENNIIKDKLIVENYETPKSAKGVGFLNAPRGGLSHWLRIEDGKIGNFQLVVPTTWNLGPRDGKDVPAQPKKPLWARRLPIPSARWKYCAPSTPLTPALPAPCMSLTVKPTKCTSSRCCKAYRSAQYMNALPPPRRIQARRRSLKQAEKRISGALPLFLSGPRIGQERQNAG